MKKISPFLRQTALVIALCSIVPNSSLLWADDKVMLNFANSDIEATVKAVGLITGKNFIIDPRVKGTINIVSSKPVNKSEVYNIMLSALRLQGYTTVDAFGTTRIIPEADAKQHYSPTIASNKIKQTGDQMVTQLYQLKYANAANIVPILRPLINPNNTINAYADSNVLVITDYADNIRRLNQIVANLDKPSASEFVTIPLKNGSAIDMAQLLSKLLPDISSASAAGSPQGFINGAPVAVGSDGAKRSIVLPDMRTNSLIVRAEGAGQLAQIQSLVSSLDVPIEGTGNIRVVYLKNAEAAKLVQTLRGVLTGEGSNDASTTTIQTSNNGQTTNAAPSTSSAAIVAGGATIQADTTTNSVIIRAPEPVYNNLRAIIDKLDARRAQVYVEALIVEVAADKVAELGLQWQDFSGVQDDGVRVIGGTNFNSSGGSTTGNIISALTSTNPLGTLGAGLNLGIIKGTISYAGKELLNLGMLAHALEGNSNINIISTPSLMTLDNEEAKITIGRNVPFLSGSYSNTGSGGVTSPFQTIERKDVGLSLKVKPQISESGTVKLVIDQEVSKIDRSTASAQGAETTKRAIQTTVLVDSGQTIVLGGLIEDATEAGESKVPLLGDIPLVGGLFRYQDRSRKKTNLLIFMRPVVLKDQRDSNQLTQDRYEYIRNEQGNFKLPAGWVMPAMPTVTVPVLENHSQGKALPNNVETPLAPQGQ